MVLIFERGSTRSHCVDVALEEAIDLPQDTLGNERKNERKNEQKNERTNERKKERKNERMNELQKNGVIIKLTLFGYFKRQITLLSG
jgi:hypothetical protein